MVDFLTEWIFFSSLKCTAHILFPVLSFSFLRPNLLFGGIIFLAGVGVLVWEGVRNGGFGWAAARSQHLTLAGIFLEHCHTHLACFTFSETKKKNSEETMQYT